MHSKLVALTLAGSGASAFVLPRGDGCCFEVTASGGKSGTVGQLGDGQNRIGGSYSPATYCINNGGITDSNGRGCILTPPTTQFQCDTGASPTTGFSISSEGEIQYNGSGKFYACGAAPSEYNIYTTAVEGQKDCVEVTLSSGGKCSGEDNGGGASSSQASIPAGSTASSKPVSEKSTAPAPSSEAKPSSYAPASPPSSGAATTPAGSQSKPSAPATGSGEAPPATEGTHAPSAPASKPSSQGQASSPPAVPSKPSAPATQESKPSVPATNVPGTSASMPASSMPAGSMPAASMPAVSPSAPAECQPSTVTVTVTQGCEAPSPSAPVVAPSGGVPASSPNGSPSGAVPSAPPAGSAPPAAPSSVASSPNGSPSGAVPSGPPAGSAPPPYASSVASSPNGSPSVPPAGSAPPSPASSAASSPGGSAPPYPSSAAPSADSSKPPAVVPSGQAPSGSAPNSAPSAPATATASGSACQTSLSGAYQTPHLIVPISSEQPNEAYGTNYNGQINSTTSTIFNFDIPQDYEGKQCSIIFLFPKKEDLETSSYDFGGSGSLGCTELSSAADQKTSYSNAPSVKKDLGSLKLQPGNSYVVATQDCQAGTTQSIELSSQGGLSLNFFEDWNPSPLGLYITSC